MSMGKGTVLADGDKAGGLLLEAFLEGATEEIAWTEVTVDDLVITVAADAMKATLNDRPGVRLPVTYEEAVTICAALGCVSPTRQMCDAMFNQAKVQLGAITLWRSPADDRKMGTVEFVLRFHDRIERELAKQQRSPGDLVFGAWKLWILHPAIARLGAVNYGFWDRSARPVKVIQTPGARHDARHYDYSQLLVPVKRTACKVRTGEPVDLLEDIARREKIPQSYLKFYEAPPARQIAPADPTLVAAFTAANGDGTKTS